MRMKSLKYILNVINKEVSKELKAKTGKNELPILLKGNGVVVTPELNYTIGKVSKRALRKQKKVLRKNIKKEQKKIEKELENKAKELLKGIQL
jgi:alanine-alpha-ketoisovalerate/valine-pyruvate aminotransferase